MEEKARSPLNIKGFWLIDILVTVFFLFIAAASLYLFRLDLLQTIDSRDEEPAGTIIIRKNIVQRCHEHRVLWDRLFEDSPVYSGDLIRAADLSAATVYMDDNQINLNENTLIRIQRDSKTAGAFKVELKEGNLSVNSGDGGSGIILNLMGRQVQAVPGTVLSAEVNEDGMIIQVNEGTATFIEEGQIRELTGGSIVAQDINGRQRTVPMAAVSRPQPNARYLKNTPEPLLVNFSWSSMNLNAEEDLRLEIASDKNFSRDFRIIETVDNTAQADLNAGLWHWRLAWGKIILNMGQVTIADASGPELLTPAADCIIRYQRDLPQLRFQWSERPGVSHYILEIGTTPDLTEPRISKQPASASFIQPVPEPGIWYWRVWPVFSSAYEGSALSSSIDSFRVEQTDDPHAPSLELPEPAPEKISASVRVTSVAGNDYTVQPGDTLYLIALEAYGMADQAYRIVNANKIENPNLIFADQVLYIPPAR
jgi:hypothetical protein